MKYAVEMGSGAMIYVPTKFHNDWFGHSDLIRGMQRHTDTIAIS
jgi:hypothetical protein